jgi:hypothetical protein
MLSDNSPIRVCLGIGNKIVSISVTSYGRFSKRTRVAKELMEASLAVRPLHQVFRPHQFGPISG